MGKLTERARIKRSEYDAVAGSLAALRERIRELRVWALLPAGTAIKAGTVVWYLGRWYAAVDDHQKSILDTPVGSAHWAETI